MTSSFMFATIALALFLSGIPVYDVQAGEFNQVLDIGDRAPDWNELPGVDGQKHSSEDLKDVELIVVAFTCNSCPYAADYEDRIVQLDKDYTDQPSKVAVIAINVNTIPSDAMPAMKVRAAEKGFNFPYLYDETQQIAARFGAHRTPTFFVLDRERRVIYMGAFDDNAQADSVSKNYVKSAIAAGLAGKAPTITETPPVGCRIRKARTRRDRDANSQQP